MTNAFVLKMQRFATLSDDDVLAVQNAVAYPTRYTPKKHIIREGDNPGSIFVILQGWACRYKILPSGTRQIMAFLMPGDTCDLHMSLLDEMDHSIQAITSADIATIPRLKMQKLMQNHPNIMQALYTSQLIDEGIMRSWIISMGRRSAIERITHLICELYMRSRDIDMVTSGDFALPLSQIILADALGLTPVHVNRIFKELRLNGVMYLKRGCISITDPQKLIKIAGFDENYLHRRLRTNA